MQMYVRLSSFAEDAAVPCEESCVEREIVS